MADKKKLRPGYKEVKVPAGANVWTSDDNGIGRMAEEGEVVHLHEETLNRDPYLARAVVNSEDMPEDDYYDKASDESLKAALDSHSIKYEDGAKHEDLVSLARMHGVAQQELEVKLNAPVSGTGKAATQAAGKK